MYYQRRRLVTIWGLTPGTFIGGNMDKMSDYETGRLDERKYIVCRMHYNKIEHTDIVRYTGVSLDDIEQWVKDEEV